MIFEPKEKLPFIVETFEEFKARGGKETKIDFGSKLNYDSAQWIRRFKPEDIPNTKAGSIHKDRLSSVAKLKKALSDEDQR